MLLRCTTLSIALWGALGLAACGDSGPGDNHSLPDPPSQAEVDSAKERLDTAVRAARVGRDALELLGIWPVYTCDAPRSTFVGDMASQFAVDHPCATVSASAMGTESDAVLITFPSGGCEVEGHTLTGDATLLFAGSTDSFSLTADLRQLGVDGLELQTEAGYVKCGDEDALWVRSQGEVPGHSTFTYTVDMMMTVQAGFPVLGSDTLILDGTATLVSAAGEDCLTFDGLAFDVGDTLPSEGRVTIVTAGGTTISAEFSSHFLYGEVEITIGNHDPVKVILPG